MAVAEAKKQKSRGAKYVKNIFLGGLFFATVLLEHQKRHVIVLMICWTSIVGLAPVLNSEAFKDWRAWPVLAMETVLHGLVMNKMLPTLEEGSAWAIGLIAIPEMLIAAVPFLWILGKRNQTHT